jgi:YesN/AraC family two-component response regulator
MAPASGEIKLLYVEDDDGTRAMLGKLLMQKYPALTIYTAANGKEGLELFHEHHPEVIVTDISMPIMNGIQMSAAIRESASEAIIIAVTAHTDTCYVSQSIDLGISHYILKPVHFGDLFAAIDSSVAAVSEKNARQEQSPR